MQIQKAFNHNHLKRYASFNVLTVALVLILFSITSVIVAQRVQAAADESALKKIMLDAFTAPSGLVVLPNTTEDLSVAITSSAIEKSRGQAKKVLTEIYDSSCLTCQNIKDGIDKSIAAQSKGQFRALGAGIRDIDWRQIVIDEDSASVTLAATLWSKVKFRDQVNKEHVVTPTAGFVEIFTLKKVDGNWVITNQVQDDVEASALPVNQLSPVKHDENSTPPAGELKPSKGPRITPYKDK